MRSWSGNAYTNWLTEQGIAYHTEHRPDCRFVDVGMPAEYSQTTWCFNEAMRFISMQEKNQPWFMSINCYDPHHPFDPPAEYMNRYLAMLDDIPLPDYIPGELDNKPVFQKKDHEGAYNTIGNYPYNEMTERDHRLIRAAYWAMIDQIDHNVGRIVQYLKDVGQYDDTLIIFTSDHGESLGDHGIYLKGPYCYETAVHVPFIIHWTGHTLENVRKNTLVEMIDIAPTLCEAAGIPAPLSFQGKSFLSLITDPDAPDHFRDSVYAKFYNSNIRHRNPLAFLTMVFDGTWKLIKVHAPDGTADQGGELYNLKNDPDEHFNLYDRPECLSERCRMLALLSDKMAQTLDPLPVRRAFW